MWAAFSGTRNQWLASLVGPPGATTIAGLTDIAQPVREALAKASVGAVLAALNSLDGRCLQLAAPPTLDDIPVGATQLVKVAGRRPTLWMNDDGTLIDLLNSSEF